MWIVALFACSEQVDLGGESDVPNEVTDERIELPEEPTEGALLVTPDFEVAPYSEVQLCSFGTWDGGDTAVLSSTSWQSPAYGHHAVFFSTTADPEEYPDGSVVDCSGSDFSLMTDMLPITMPTTGAQNGAATMVLPAGMAVDLPQGTRWVLQSHYVNPTADTLLVRDAMTLQTIDPAEVETFASVFVHVSVGFEVPPGETVTERIDCTWEEEVEVLTVFGHMHEYGDVFTADHHTGDGSVRLYEVEDWGVEHRDAPPITLFEPGELVLKPGDVFETSCTWSNSSDHALAFPEEMCAFTGLVYPARDPVLCIR